MKKQKKPTWKCMSKTYMTWAAMKQRCYNPKNPGYKNWGGRGITVCDRWLDSYENFLADMGEIPKGLTLERIDNNGNYCKENCRLATHKEQCRNTRKSKLIEYKGEIRSASEWAEIMGISYPTITHRLKLNLPLEELFEKDHRKSSSHEPKRFLTFKDKTLSITDWANTLGVNRKSFARRCYAYQFDPKKIEQYIGEKASR